MSSRDFLHTSAATPLTAYFNAAGAVCSLSTNCEILLRVARNSFSLLSHPSGQTDFSLRFWVDDAGSTEPPWPKPWVRGVDHLVFAGFETGSSLLADLRERRVIGRFSAGMAHDSKHWRMVIFPMLMSIIAGSAGLVELHASCVASGHHGLLLLGPSRSGKSTLAMAFAEAGCRFIADDRTFCSMKEGRLLAHGLPRPLKLRSEAGEWFDEFRGRAATDIQNGEPVYYHEPNRSVPANSLACAPRALVFLERQSSSGFRMTRMGREAESIIEQDLLAEAPAAVQKQAVIVDQLLALPCLRLRYGGAPQDVARHICEALSDFSEACFPGGRA